MRTAKRLGALFAARFLLLLVRYALSSPLVATWCHVCVNRFLRLICLFWDVVLLLANLLVIGLPTVAVGYEPAFTEGIRV
eukprot:5271764-Pleurochrysis_carterae.AAC.2